MKSTQPPPADPDLARFLAELKEIGEEDARLAYLARLMGQEEPPPSSDARRDSA